MKKYSDPTVHKEQYHLQRVLVFNGSECFRCPRQLYKVSFHTVKSFSYNSHVIHLQGGFFSWWVKALTGIIWFSLNNFKFKVGYLNGDKECNVQQNTHAYLERAVGVSGGLLSKTAAVWLLTDRPQQVWKRQWNMAIIAVPCLSSWIHAKSIFSNKLRDVSNCTCMWYPRGNSKVQQRSPVQMFIHCSCWVFIFYGVNCESEQTH